MTTAGKHNQITPRESLALQDLVEVLHPAVIVEFGSWEGRSALAFLSHAKSSGYECRMICVDTWLGSAEHWGDLIPNSEWSFERLKVRRGEPNVLQTFRKAVRDHGFDEQTSIVRAPTSSAAPFLKRTGVRADLVYIDADHSYRAVLGDLRLAYLLKTSGGVVAGDDFGWHSVRLAVGRFASSSDVVLVRDGQFVILNSNQKRIRQGLLNRGWEVRRWILSRQLPMLLVSLAPRSLRKVIDSVYRWTR